MLLRRVAEDPGEAKLCKSEYINARRNLLRLSVDPPTWLLECDTSHAFARRILQDITVAGVVTKLQLDIEECILDIEALVERPPMVAAVQTPQPDEKKSALFDALLGIFLGLTGQVGAIAAGFIAPASPTLHLLLIGIWITFQLSVVAFLCHRRGYFAGFGKLILPGALVCCFVFSSAATAHWRAMTLAKEDLADSEPTEDGSRIDTSPTLDQEVQDSPVVPMPRDVKVEFPDAVPGLGVSSDGNVKLAITEMPSSGKYLPTATLSAEDRIGIPTDDPRLKILVQNYSKNERGNINGAEAVPSETTLPVCTLQVNAWPFHGAKVPAVFATRTYRLFTTEKLLQEWLWEYKSVGSVSPVASVSTGLAAPPPGSTVLCLDGKPSAAFMRFNSSLMTARPYGLAYHIGVKAGERANSRLLFGMPSGALIELRRKSRSMWIASKVVDGVLVPIGELNLRSAFDAIFQFSDDASGKCRIHVDTISPASIPFEDKAGRKKIRNTEKFELTAHGMEWPMTASLQSEGAVVYLRAVLVSTHLSEIGRSSVRRILREASTTAQ